MPDQTELEIVNFINICYKHWFFYEFMTTELLINKDVSKADETFMTNVFLNAENEISDFLVASCFNRVIVLKQKMWILLEFITKSFVFYILSIKLNSWLTDPFKLNVILSKENEISDMSCCILV